MELSAGDGIKPLVFFNDLKSGIHLTKVDSSDLSQGIANAKFSFEAVDGSWGPVEYTTLADGTIDLIATDHAPHSAEEKAKPITEAPSGIIGLETSLSLGIMNLVHTGALTMERLLACMTVNPAGLYGLDAGRIYEGGPADLILFNENEEWVPEKFRSKSQNSPFLGQKLTGKVKLTVCRGRIVYEDQKEIETGG